MLRAAPTAHQLRLPVPARVVVLVSGSGTLLQALLDATGPHYPAQVVAVGADRAGVEGLARAEKCGVPTFVVELSRHSETCSSGSSHRHETCSSGSSHRHETCSSGSSHRHETCSSGSSHRHPDRASWDAALTAAVAVHQPDLVVSAGFMKILGPAFLDRFAGRIVNTHPALLPAFPGRRPVADALAHGVQVSGATVHLVDAGVDTGPILAQCAVQVLTDDTEDRLHERIKVVERRLLVDVVAELASRGCTVTGRKVSFP
ncbi:MAG TPA: phosphoribosylglycinamide formyltransferase [Pseudonocardiaceae bacterium]